jgi:subtilase family serine protease
LLSAYTPIQIRHAYGFDQVSVANLVNAGNEGAGQTIAIVDTYFDATIQKDLEGFNQRFGLPQLDGKGGDGTFTQFDLSNKTPSPVGDDWTLETALDVEWAHAIAPKANIVLVEAASDFQDSATGEPTDLLHAVQFAATKASVVSMSWGISEVPQETNWDPTFNKPGVTFVAASGDNGAGTLWPAVSPYVVSVGGTSLNLTRSGSVAGETGWGHGGWSPLLGGSGGGFSQYEGLPSFQQNSGISSSLTQFGARLSPDVAYDADPNTGFYVLDSAAGGWNVVGGTSAGAPQWAALIAIADQARGAGQELSSTQTLGSLYGHAGDFSDINHGNTGAYYVVNDNGNVVGTVPVRAGAGYDLVTGLGTPVANKLIPDLAGLSAASSHNTVQAAPVSSSSSATAGKQSKAKKQDIPATILTTTTAMETATATTTSGAALLLLTSTRPTGAQPVVAAITPTALPIGGAFSTAVVNPATVAVAPPHVSFNGHTGTTSAAALEAGEGQDQEDVEKRDNASANATSPSPVLPDGSETNDDPLFDSGSTDLPGTNGGPVRSDQGDTATGDDAPVASSDFDPVAIMAAGIVFLGSSWTLPAMDQEELRRRPHRRGEVG